MGTSYQKDEGEGEFFQKYERRLKDAELMEALEGVFDARTLSYVSDLLRRGVISRFVTNISEGKEARVYLAESGTDLVVVKIYFTGSSDYYKTMPLYMQGDPRFSRIRKSRREIVETWARKEYANLALAFGSGVHVPRPWAVRGNVLVMDLLGDESGPAPRLKDVKLSGRQWKETYRALISDLELLVTKAGLVHADLSEYNVLYWKQNPYMIDFGQAVLTSHPHAEEFLRRDLSNLASFFAKKGIGLKEASEEELVRKWLALSP
ncbi:MAG: serine protein kinase RIO [Thermoprotei archaeon]|nr:serine protein kinase RIO [TACK group archaeon]